MNKEESDKYVYKRNYNFLKQEKNTLAVMVCVLLLSNFYLIYLLEK